MLLCLCVSQAHLRRKQINMKSKLLAAIVLASASVVAAAQHNWQLSSTYTFSLDPEWGPVEVTNIIAIMEGGSVNNTYGWGSTTWPLSSSSSPVTLGFDTYWFDPFAAEPTVIGSLFLGIVRDLPDDPPGQDHVVLFMDSQAAGNINNIAWGTIFSNTNEESLLFAIEQATTLPLEEAESYWGEIDTFVHGDGMHGHLGPSGTEGSAWFGPNEDFSIVAFSDAKIIGSGTNLVQTTLQPVPEPCSMVVLGIGALVALRKRRCRV
jgi:hypothetical protein